MGPVPRSAILFFIPGNPGISAYYRTFFDALQSRHPGLDIVTSNHVGFNGADTPRPAKYIDLDAQIAHKIDLLEAILFGRSAEEKSRRIPIFLAGHSVGAYMAIKVLAARPECVARVYLLFPTLSHIAQSPQGVVTTALLRVPGLVSAASNLVWGISAVMPLSWKYAVVRWFTGFSGDAVAVTADQVLTRTAVHSALTLARSEMSEINAPDRAFWTKFASRCRAYWATSDRWVADKHRAELLGMAQGMESHHCGEAPHAFCIRHGELVAEQVADWLDRDIPLGYESA